MIIKFKKIRRHWWLPFMYKEIILEIDGVEQPFCVGWEMRTVGEKYEVKTNY